MSCFLTGLTAAFFFLPLARTEDEPELKVIKVPIVASAKATPRALRYPLMPDPLDQISGNAAIYWSRAGKAASEQLTKLKPDQQDLWLSGLTLKEVPKASIRKFLDESKVALRLADQASRCDRCDWEQGPLTLQNFHMIIDPLLFEVQQARVVAALLSIQCRLQLSEGDFDGANHTIQIGMSLSRNLTKAPATLIQYLVGIAVESIMLNLVEEWIQIPGSPNLYWSLTALPSNAPELQESIRYELDTLYRSFPKLRNIDREKMDASQMQTLIDEIIESITKIEGSGEKPWQMRLGFGVLTARAYPDAKQFLLDRGETKEHVESMPTLQVVLIHLLSQYEKVHDDTLKWTSVPYFQGRAGMEQVEKDVRALRDSPGGVIVVLLFPAVLKVYEAGVRTDRNIAALRCVEAIRLKSTADGGKLPAKLSEIKIVPLPVDPVTGKDFGAAYKVDGGAASFDVTPVTGKPGFPAKRFTFGAAK